MIRHLWTRGRFGWSFIALVMFHTFLLIAFDYVWRLVQMPFLHLVLVFVGFWIIGNIVIAIVTLRLSRG